MRARLVLLGSLLLAACKVAPVPLPPALVASTGSAGLGSEVPRPLPPVATPGEQMSYRITIHGLEVADYAIAIGERTSIDGVDVVVVQSSARSSRLASLVKQVADDFTTYIDRTTGRSVRFIARELASKSDQVKEETEGRFTADRITIHVERADGIQRDEVQTLTGSGGYDVVSFLMFLRGWEAEPGARLEADVMRSRYTWRQQLVVVGYENLATVIGEVAVVRFDGEAVRLERDGTIDPDSDRRRWSIWISDDADRVPLRLVARTDYGDVVMDLVAYQPAATTAR